tara:strand:- start:2675 stop:3637 length:963 start_codon:yes stop_codon:yes gene_type:complete
MREELLVRGRIADDTGVDTLWINEGFGHDAFSGMTLLAVETSNVRLGTAVVNVYSRTAGALAQHYATLDQLSNGRIVAGLGTSGTGVIERFHGLTYQPAIQRLSETVKLLQAFWRHERITYHGAWYDIDRAIVMGIDPVQSELPIYLATLHPNSVRLTAEQADGWLPAWIPFERLGAAITEMRAWSADAGRDPMTVDVRAPSMITVVNDAAKAEKVRENRRQQLAFFVARNGDFYYRQFVRHGFADEAALIRRDWNSNGAEAGIAALPKGLEDHFDFIGPLEACIEKIEMQAELGVDLHQVSVHTEDRAEWGKSIHRLVG